MKIKNKLYERYTTTSSLASDVDEQKVLTWSKGYFRANYSGLIPRDKGAKILEVGCGYGRYLVALSEMGYTNCYGIDLSSEQVAYAQTVLQLTNVEQADALEWLNDKDSVFDCILGLDILEHFPTDELLKLGEMMHKALKPGGTVIFQVPNALSPLNPIIYGDLTHVRAFTQLSMQQFLLNVGFVSAVYSEVSPYVYGIRSAIQKVLWIVLIKPLLRAFFLVIHGRVGGGNIFSSNFITRALKDASIDRDELKHK